MAKYKYTCRCGKRTDKLTSYFKNEIRVTVCDDCAKEYNLINDDKIIQVDYDKIKNSNKEENFYHMIDTREKIR